MSPNRGSVGLGADFEGFSVTVRSEGNGRTVAVSGELDLATQAQFERALTGALVRGTRELVIDLTALDFIDATGIGALMRYSHKARRRGIHISISLGDGEPRRALALSGLIDTFDLI